MRAAVGGACGVAARYRQSRGSPGAHAKRSTDRRRKRLRSGRCVSRTQWPVAQSSEQSCGSLYKGTRARGSRCRRQVCAGVRTCGESANSRPLLPDTNVLDSVCSDAGRSPGREGAHGIGNGREAGKPSDDRPHARDVAAAMRVRSSQRVMAGLLVAPVSFPFMAAQNFSLLACR